MFQRAFLVTACVLLFVSPSLDAGEVNYLVVSLVEKGDPYEQAGAKLVQLRNAKGTRASIKDWDSLLTKLRKSKPEFVAFVARPEQINVNFARQLFELATRVDDDPFVDFGYGVITGHTPEDAIRLAEAGVRSESKRRKPSLGILGVAEGDMLKKSQSQDQVVPLPGLALPMTWATIATDDPALKQEFLDKTLKRLQSKPLFAFAGHGYPDGIVNGPKHHDLHGRDFGGAIVYNVGCYTGVTSDWYETDFQSSNTTARENS